MLKKIMLGILVFSSISFARTNKEIIDAGNTMQKTVFDKYFNSSNSEKNKKDSSNSVYVEIMTNLYNENRGYFDKEFVRLSGNRRSNFRTMYLYYSDYIVEYPKFLKNAFGAFLDNIEEFQSYAYTNKYLLLETFNLNMNTYLEAERDEKTVEDNINVIYDYLYSVGDKVQKDDYKKMSSSKVQMLVNEEYDKLEKLLDERGNEGKEMQKATVAAKSRLKKLKKLYSNYDKWFDDYVDTSSLSNESKEKLKKIVKFENISNIKFIIKSIEKKNS